MNRGRLYYIRLLLAVAIIITLSGLAACTLAPSNSALSAKAATGENNLALFQQYGNVSARFYGLMTFKFSGTTFAYPSEFEVSFVPIVWMDKIFSGKLKEGGPGQDVTDEVHGSLSADGAWLESLSFSRQIIRTTLKTGVSYRVTFRNLPTVNMIKSVDAEPAVFTKSGTDLQKHIEEIRYTDGPLSNGQIIPATTYLSTDWKNTSSGQMPLLKITFTKETKAQGTGKPGMGMGR